ncbi:MAG: C40 family peptidase [Oligoflexia bacterium]|nr:C40 family peptidase [Oligoflexia bacterium]
MLPDTFDCSSFVHLVYTDRGMPYGTKENPAPNVQSIINDQEHWKEIALDEAQPGDLIIHLQGEAGKKTPKYNHVGIFSGIDKRTGAYMEISAQSRRGKAKLKDAKKREAPVQNSPTHFFGDPFHIYRRKHI